MDVCMCNVWWVCSCVSESEQPQEWRRILFWKSHAHIFVIGLLGGAMMLSTKTHRIAVVKVRISPPVSVRRTGLNNAIQQHRPISFHKQTSIQSSNKHSMSDFEVRTWFSLTSDLCHVSQLVACRQREAPNDSDDASSVSDRGPGGAVNVCKRWLCQASDVGWSSKAGHLETQWVWHRRSQCMRFYLFIFKVNDRHDGRNVSQEKNVRNINSINAADIINYKFRYISVKSTELGYVKKQISIK